MLASGSEALLQVCIRAEQLESSLKQLDGYLASEKYRRLDVPIARRCDLEGKKEESPSDYLEHDLPGAGQTDAPATACDFTSKDSATILQEKGLPNKADCLTMHVQKPRSDA